MFGTKKSADPGQDDAQDASRDEQERAIGAREENTGDDQEPEAAPTDVHPLGWWAALKRVPPRLKELNIQLLAAACAFWAVLSIFPAFIALVSIYGLVNDPSDVQRQVNSALSSLSPSTQQSLGSVLTNITRTQGLSIGLVLSVLVLLWSASGGMQNLMQAVTTAYEQHETRGFVKKRGTALLLTLGAIVVLVLLLLAVGAMPVLLRNVLDNGVLRVVLNIVGYLVVLALVWGAISVLYRFGPANKPVGVRWASAGAAVATVLITIITVVFAIYVRNFSNYANTYGTLAGVIVFMLWLNYAALALLVGALLNAEVEREAQGDAASEPEGSRRDITRSPSDPD